MQTEVQNALVAGSIPLLATTMLCMTPPTLADIQAARVFVGRYLPAVYRGTRIPVHAIADTIRSLASRYKRWRQESYAWNARNAPALHKVDNNEIMI